MLSCILCDRYAVAGYAFHGEEDVVAGLEDSELKVLPLVLFDRILRGRRIKICGL